MDYIWSTLLGPAFYFSGYFFDDVTAEWAEDLVATLLCWLQMGFCWMYSTILDMLYAAVKEILPALPNWALQIIELVNLFDTINSVVPMYESMALFVLWLPFYLLVRILYIAQPWAG